jgi:hypothetical protein
MNGKGTHLCRRYSLIEKVCPLMKGKGHLAALYKKCTIIMTGGITKVEH